MAELSVDGDLMVYDAALLLRRSLAGVVVFTQVTGYYVVMVDLMVVKPVVWNVFIQTHSLIYARIRTHTQGNSHAQSILFTYHLYIYFCFISIIVRILPAYVCVYVCVCICVLGRWMDKNTGNNWLIIVVTVWIKRYHPSSANFFFLIITFPSFCHFFVL